jgi:predicted dehydrogenase
MQTALQCARRGIKLFIEKPIGHNLELLNDLLLACKHLTTYIAYPLRHIPAITDLIKKIATERIYHAQFVCRSYLPEWRYYSTYSTYKNQGGGAILDLSHEIDLATFLCGNIERITGIFGKKSDVTYDAEDYADIIIEHEYGITSNIHLDLFSKLQLRWFELSTDQQRSYIINLYGDIHHYDKTSNMVASDIYLKQLQYFFNNINDNRMMNNIHDASDMFRKVIEWKEDQYEQSN